MSTTKQFQLARHGLGALPIIDHVLKRMRLHALLSEAMGSERAADGICLLAKNVIVERNTLYAIRKWASLYDPALVYGGDMGDDGLARSLDKLFRSDRSSLLTRIVLHAVTEFKIDMKQFHQDTTSVKLHGAYSEQNPKAVQLKRGHSKDHRPDLKQLVYELTVSRDGAIPVHFKPHDGNRTDDTLHWDNWQALRGIAGRSDFLYVADSKLCVKATLMKIDCEHGKFITVLPRTRAEAARFGEQILCDRIRWKRILVKRSSRRKGRMDVFDVAQGHHQMEEGFKLHWFRSSEKRRRDQEDREGRIDHALDYLRSLNENRKRGPRTEAAIRSRADKILARFKAKDWVGLEIALERVEKFKQKKRGRANEDSDFRRIVSWVPKLTAKRDYEAIAKAQAMDGVFPLATNTDLKPIDILNAYKYQPKLEKRHALLKSGLKVAPVFLKKNDRIEALMFVYFLAQMVSAIVEREVRTAMTKKNIPDLKILPEDRPSSTPTAEQILGAFEHRARHRLRSKDGIDLQTFSDPLTPVQHQILKMFDMQPSTYT